VISGARALATPCSQFLNVPLTAIAARWPRPAGGDLRGGPPFIEGAIVARSGDRRARSHARLLGLVGMGRALRRKATRRRRVAP
jgi:hypothetical protein